MDKRNFLIWSASALASSLLPASAIGAPIMPDTARRSTLIATWRSSQRLARNGAVLETAAQPIDYVGLLEPDWEQGQIHIRQAVPIPARVHGLLPDPDGGLIAVAFRPGAWLMRVNADGEVTHQQSIGEERRGRTLDGHAVLDPSGQWLLSTETDVVSGSGWISVRDRRTLKKVAEWPSHGIEPHQACFDRAGKLLIANGGILRAAGDRKRDLDAMDSSLVRLDISSGELLGQWRLNDKRLSLRHLALAQAAGDDSSGNRQLLGIAIEAEHDDAAKRAAAPVLAIWDGKDLSTPTHVPVARGYSSDIVAGPGGGFYLNGEFANKVMLWHPGAPAELTVVADLQRARSLATWQADSQNGVLIGAKNGMACWHPTLASRFLRWPIDMAVDIHWAST
jgi:hypothetical protein